MKIPTWLASILVTAIVGLQCWTLNEIVSLKISVAALSERVNQATNHLVQK